MKSLKLYHVGDAVFVDCNFANIYANSQNTTVQIQSIPNFIENESDLQIFNYQVEDSAKKAEAIPHNFESFVYELQLSERLTKTLINALLDHLDPNDSLKWFQVRERFRNLKVTGMLDLINKVGLAQVKNTRNFGRASEKKLLEISKKFNITLYL